MAFKKEYLDLVLVPSGLMILLAYHLFLLYRYLKLPHTTFIGYENNDKRAWVQRILQADKKNVSLALQVLSSNTTAATFLATVSLTLCSLIGAWLGNSSNNIFSSHIIYGDTSPSIISVKYLSLLICFIIAFACFVQSVRSFVHANYLISTPNSDVPVKHIEAVVISGGEFWTLGIRTLYFALNLLLWFFGPITMLVSSVLIVIILQYLDTNSTPLHVYENGPSQPSGLMIKRVDERSPEEGGDAGIVATC